MSAITGHLEQVNDPTVSSEELTYDKLSARARTVGADEVLALFPPLPVKAPAAAVVAPRPVSRQAPVELPRRQQTPQQRQQPQTPRQPHRQTPGQPQFAPVEAPRNWRSPTSAEMDAEDDEGLNSREFARKHQRALLDMLIDELENRAAEQNLAPEEIPDADFLTVDDIARLDAIDDTWRDFWAQRIEDGDDYEGASEHAQRSAGGMRGLGDSSVRASHGRKALAREELLARKRLSSEAEAAAAYLWSSHAELLRMSFVRAGAAEALVGRTITPMRVGDCGFDVRGAAPDDVILVLDKAVESVQAFASMQQPMRFAALLSWTTKMDCPSYSLPAGPPGAGFNGSCPGAVGGQTIVPETRGKQNQQNAIFQIHQKNRARVETQVGKKLDDTKWAELANVNLADCVCQSCYAEEGNYSYTSSQLAGLIRQAWTASAVENGSFVTVMDYAVKHADFYLDGGKRGGRGDVDLAPEPALDANTGEPAKFFRIHDSGDWFSERYYLAWCQIAERNPDVTFWAPTRVWALTRDWVNDSPPPENMVVRPSAYMFNRPAALLRSLVRGAGRGYSAPSVSYTTDKANPLPNFIESGYPYHWQCQVYAGEERRSCRSAMSPPTSENPDGTIGCRACWVFPNLSINYKKH